MNPHEFTAAERDILKRQGAIAAIRAFRERTGFGLMEGKRALDLVKREAMKCGCGNNAKYRVSVTDLDGGLLDSTYLCPECFGGSDISTVLTVGSAAESTYSTPSQAGRGA